jgi:hypothetical protein
MIESRSQDRIQNTPLSFQVFVPFWILTSEFFSLKEF